MDKRLTTRVLGAGFAAALLFGGAACGDDDTRTDVTDRDEADELDTMGGTDSPDAGWDAGDGLGGPDDDGIGTGGVRGQDDGIVP